MKWDEMRGRPFQVDAINTGHMQNVQANMFCPRSYVRVRVFFFSFMRRTTRELWQGRRAAKMNKGNERVEHSEIEENVSRLIKTKIYAKH